jgi:hypothetical protein
MGSDPASAGAAARRRRMRGALAPLCACALLGVALAGCGRGQPTRVASLELAAAQTFPYYRVYWAGPSFEGRQVTGADGLDSYNAVVGDGVYYGECVQAKGILGGGRCGLLLQVTTVVFHRHSNQPLGAQRNLVVRGVPAVVYDEGRSIELYSGQVAIDVFSNDFAHALRGAEQLYPINAPGSAREALPAPVYCPGLYGHESAEVARVMESLPAHICKRARAQTEYLESVKRPAR